MKAIMLTAYALLASAAAPPAIESGVATAPLAKVALVHALVNDSFQSAHITDDALFTNSGDGIEMACTIQCVRFGEPVTAAVTARLTKAEDGLHVTSYRMSAANPFSATSTPLAPASQQ